MAVPLPPCVVAPWAHAEMSNLGMRPGVSHSIVSPFFWTLQPGLKPLPFASRTYGWLLYRTLIVSPLFAASYAACSVGYAVPVRCRMNGGVWTPVTTGAAGATGVGVGGATATEDGGVGAGVGAGGAVTGVDSTCGCACADGLCSGFGTVGTVGAPPMDAALAQPANRKPLPALFRN